MGSEMCIRDSCLLDARSSPPNPSSPPPILASRLSRAPAPLVRTSRLSHLCPRRELLLPRTSLPPPSPILASRLSPLRPRRVLLLPQSVPSSSLDPRLSTLTPAPSTLAPPPPNPTLLPSLSSPLNPHTCSLDACSFSRASASPSRTHRRRDFPPDGRLIRAEGLRGLSCPRRRFAPALSRAARSRSCSAVFLFRLSAARCRCRCTALLGGAC